MTKKKHNVAIDRAGQPWGYAERDGYWGPFSEWNHARPSFFTALAVAQMDAAAMYEHLHKLPVGFPLPLLGQPSAAVDQRGMKFYRTPFALVTCGCKLDVLLLRLRLMAVECESFRTLKEGMEAR